MSSREMGRIVLEIESQVSSVNEQMSGSVLEEKARGETGFASEHTLYLMCLWDIQSGM